MGVSAPVGSISVPACPSAPITGRLKLIRAVTPTVKKTLI